MEFPVNQLKRNLRAGKVQVGCWLSLASPVAAEICAGAGFDWVLIDTEHAPNELHMVHAQLHAVSAYPVATVVRIPWNETVVIKRLLDLGVQSLLIPNVQSVAEAKQAVAAVRYPPRGVRGVSTSTRANRYGRVKDYLAYADDNICLIVQLETRAALRELEGIAALDGIDALFIGPQDLAADFGQLGNPAHSEVQAAMADAISRIKRAGKAPGILNFNEPDAKRWIDLGAQFLAITSDQFLLTRESASVAARFRA